MHHFSIDNCVVEMVLDGQGWLIVLTTEMAGFVLPECCNLKGEKEM